MEIEEMEEMEEKSKTVKKFLGLRMKANSRSNSLIRILGGMSSLNTVELIKLWNRKTTFVYD